MPNPKRRHSKTRTAKRRTHDALKPIGRSECPQCHEAKLPHQVCPACGYYAQVPHYISGPYPAATVALLHAVGRHVDADLVDAELVDEARQLRERLDAAAALEETTRTYVERLETMVDEERLPSGDDLISEIEQFLRESGGEGRGRA